MNIKKGDTVRVIAGKDRGKTGKVVHVIPSAGRVTVEGVNVYKKHVRPKRQGEKGETVEVSRPLNASNVMLLCPSCGEPTRLGRSCKKCKVAF